MVNNEKASAVTPSEIKKMKQGMSYSKKEKTIIMNVFKYFRSQHPDKTVTEIVRRTAKATGCSEKSIFSFRKEEVSPHGFREPSKTKIRKMVNINNRLVKYDESVRNAIKTIICDLKKKNIVPSLSVILKNMTSNNLPSFSIMTLRRLLYDMGFCYEKNGNKSILVEKNAPKKHISNLNSPAVIKKPLEPTQSVLKESSRSVLNSVNKAVENNDPHLSENPGVTSAVIKVNNERLQSYPQINVHPAHRIQALGSFQENHFTSLNAPSSSSHMQMMFPPRMPAYDLHSSGPHPYPHSDMNLHLKRQGPSGPSSHQQLLAHNVIMH